MPRVSVVIPAYNAEAFAAQAVESLRAQTWQDFEVIAVDDGSEDATAEVFRRFPEVRLVSVPHGGIARARNAGVSAAGGELIAFVDADDRWLPDKLEKQVSYLDAHPDCLIVFTRYRNFTDIPAGELDRLQTELLGNEIDRLLVTSVIRKEAFDRFGLFDTSLVYAEDTEWLYRLRLKCPERIAKLGEVLYERRIHGGNITLTHEDLGQQEIQPIIARAIRNLNRGKA